MGKANNKDKTVLKNVHNDLNQALDFVEMAARRLKACDDKHVDLNLSISIVKDRLKESLQFCEDAWKKLVS